MTPHWPQLFLNIIENDRERSELYASGVIPFWRMSDLLRARRYMTKDAERALSWNTDKGK